MPLDHPEPPPHANRSAPPPPKRSHPTPNDRALGYHVTLRLSDDRGIARDVPSLRAAARTILRHGDSAGMLAFRIADTHAHVLLTGSRRDVTHFTRETQTALRKRLSLPVPFERSRAKVVADPRHLANTMRYVLRQEDHHGTHFDPAHEGSCLPDLLGMRVVDGGALVRRVRSSVPRLTRADLLECLGAGELAEPTFDLGLVGDAAAAAFALRDHTGITDAHCKARGAAIAVAAPHASLQAIATTLGVDPRSVRRCLARPVDPASVLAVELQLRMRIAQRAACSESFAPS